MPKLTVLVGLPASGKTTLAREIVNKDPDHTIRVNNDDIRKMFWGHPYNSPREDLIHLLVKSILNDCLLSRTSVVIDNLNLGKNVKTYKDWARLNEYDFESILVDTPIDECIRRDSLREVPVGERVIRQFAKGFENAKATQVQNQ